MMGWNMGWGGGMVFGGFLGLLVLAAVVVLVVLIARGSDTQGSNSNRTCLADSERMRSDNTPLEILQTRYAKGEIDKEEYETKRRDLEIVHDPSG